MYNTAIFFLHINKITRHFHIGLANCNFFVFNNSIFPSWSFHSKRHPDFGCRFKGLLILVQDNPGNINDYFRDFVYSSSWKEVRNILVNLKPGHTTCSKHFWKIPQENISGKSSDLSCSYYVEEINNISAKLNQEPRAV